MEEIQRQKRAKTSGGQSRENRDWMDETLIQNAKDDVNNQNGHHQQHGQPGKRRLKRLRIPLKGRRGRCRQSVSGQVVDLVDGVADRCASLQVE